MLRALPRRARSARRRRRAPARPRCASGSAARSWCVAFVAEFSRGKSELINAIFFADTGRRVLPATPGRTTMCPVELGYDAGEPPALLLLPIETRLEGLSLAELRSQPARLDARSRSTSTTPDALAEALQEVTRTKRGQLDDGARARLLGRRRTPTTTRRCDDRRPWSRCRPGATRSSTTRTRCCKRGPGRARHAGPERDRRRARADAVACCRRRTPWSSSCGADTGVTKSDLAIWRDHLGAPVR